MSSSVARLRARPTADQWSEHYRRMSEGRMAGKTVYTLKSGRGGSSNKTGEESIKAVSQAATALEQAKDAFAEQKARTKETKKRPIKTRRIGTNEDDIFA
jgi:hypothetical protein